MRVIEESIHQAYVMVEKVVIRIKTNLELPDTNSMKYCTGIVLSGERKGKYVVYLSYDQIEINDFSRKILLVPVNHVLCEVEPEENEEVVAPVKFARKEEPWLNLNI